jgi:hypothetical protein
VRGDLRLQQMQTRVERLSLELTALEREGELLMAREGFLLPNDRRERRPGRDKDGGEGEEHPVGVLPE